VKGFRSSYGDICVGDPQTRRYRRVRATRAFHEMEAVQSPSKRWFAVVGMHGLYVMSARGDRRRVLVRNPGLLPPTSNIPHSPDWRPQKR
jgi:hypothetical protein